MCPAVERTALMDPHSKAATLDKSFFTHKNLFYIRRIAEWSPGEDVGCKRFFIHPEFAGSFKYPSKPRLRPIRAERRPALKVGM